MSAGYSVVLRGNSIQSASRTPCANTQEGRGERSRATPGLALEAYGDPVSSVALFDCVFSALFDRG
jgi:hypothetical protein